MEEQMPSLADEAFEWLDRAEQAREVAEQLTDPSASNAVKQLAESFERLARAAVTQQCSEGGSWRGSAREETRNFFLAPLSVKTQLCVER
jgi:hypothetical protein